MTVMHIRPILAALKRHKAGVLLIALQIALTLAIVCNALFIIEQRLARLSVPTGIDEANTFVITNQWALEQSKTETDAHVRADLSVLRQLPSVADAVGSNSFPLRGGGWDDLITLTPDQKGLLTDSAVYMGDEHFLSTLNMTLLAGRNFRPDEVLPQGTRESVTPSVVIVTKVLADKLYPNGDALGKPLYAMTSTPSTIIGVVNMLQRQSVDTWNTPYLFQSMIWPLRPAQDMGLYYVIRAKPGQLAAALRAAPQALYAAYPMRVIPPKDGVMTFAQVRQNAYDSDRGMAILMSIICVVLLGITGAGIVGLTSFWVGQRRRQIGVRRALGATHRDILHYFLTENFLISAGGIAIGIVLTFAFNLWLVTHMEMKLIPPTYICGGVVILLLLGQGAVLAPALRASRVPPVEATRPV